MNSQLISAIISASRRPCPEIVAVNYLLCSDGEYRGEMGIPLSVQVVKPYVMKCVGFAYRYSLTTPRHLWARPVMLNETLSLADGRAPCPGASRHDNRRWRGDYKKRNL